MLTGDKAVGKRVKVVGSGPTRTGQPITVTRNDELSGRKVLTSLTEPQMQTYKLLYRYGCIPPENMEQRRGALCTSFRHTSAAFHNRKMRMQALCEPAPTCRVVFARNCRSHIYRCRSFPMVSLSCCGRELMGAFFTRCRYTIYMIALLFMCRCDLWINLILLGVLHLL